MDNKNKKKSFIEKIMDLLFSLPFFKKKEEEKKKNNKETDDIYPLW
jgi:hypothetical protein